MLDSPPFPVSIFESEFFLVGNPQEVKEKMASSNNFFSGIIDMLILYFLRQKDCYGYEMTKAVSELSEGLLTISINTIYTSIYKMENYHLLLSYGSHLINLHKE